ncbi:MAG: branched-chain amino acid transporter permease, partial [Deltaproteobacteria bacterium]|nr:branched-chain amino acid transporter permease [Deltaproteobacteria bacterium]
MLIAQLINGLTQGSIYALIAIGFVIIFGTMNLVTFAHGEVYMIGAFMGYFALTILHLPWYIALVMGMGAAWILGFFIEKIAFRPLRSAGHMPPLLITIGLAIIFKDLVVIFLGAE